jgi:hypothetical protein
VKRESLSILELVLLVMLSVTCVSQRVTTVSSVRINLPFPSQDHVLALKDFRIAVEFVKPVLIQTARPAQVQLVGIAQIASQDSLKTREAV